VEESAFTKDVTQLFLSTINLNIVTNINLGLIQE